jgi:hypothetical protein
VPVATLVAVELAVWELGAGQQMLDERKGLIKLRIALHHGATIRLLEVWVDGLLDEFAQEHEHHASRRAVGDNLGLVPRRGVSAQLI